VDVARSTLADPLADQMTPAQLGEVAAVLAPFGEAGPSVRLHCARCRRRLDTVQAADGALRGARRDEYVDLPRAGRETLLPLNAWGSGRFERWCGCGAHIDMTQVRIAELYATAARGARRLYLRSNVGTPREGARRG